MFRLTQLSLRNRAVVALVSIAILVGGILSLTGLKQEMIPSIEIPYALVTATNPGVASDLVEDQLAEPIEGAIASVPGVESVNTTSVNSMLIAVVAFEYGTNMDISNQKLSTAVSRLQRQLPSSVETNVMTGSLDDFPVVMVGISGQDNATLDRMVNEVLKTRITRLEGVRSVQITGFEPEQVVIEPNPQAMTLAGVTMDQISGVLQDNGLMIPAGEIEDGNRTLTVQAGQRVSTVEQLSALPLTVTTPETADPTGQQGWSGQASTGLAIPTGPVTLGDVAQVTSGPQPTSSYLRIDATPAVAISITKTPAGNAVDVSHAVRDTLDELQSSLDKEGMKSMIVFDQAPFIEDSIDGLLEEGLAGLGFAVLVILVFLFSIRATLVSAVSIPLSLLMAFIGMTATGETLNILTLGAVTISIGRVVDDSIVVIENIKRHLSYGERKRTAIVGAVREVGGAVAASTFCTAAVFLPLAFTGGMVGELFRPFGLTVALALFGSLLVALTIVPVLAYWFVRAPVAIDEADQAQQRAEAETKERHSFWQRIYLPTLATVLRHPVVTLVAAVAVLGGTAALIPTLETNFLGEMGGNQLSVSQSFHASTALDVQNDQAETTEKAISQVDGIAEVATQVGGGGAMGMSLSTSPEATYYLTLEEGADAVALESEVRAAVEAVNGPTVKDTAVAGGESTMMASSGIELEIHATDSESLVAAAEQVSQVARQTEGVAEVSNSLAEDQPRVQVTVDRVKAKTMGLSETAVDGLLRGMMVPSQIGSLNTDDGQVPVILRMGTPASDVTGLQALPLMATPAGFVTVGDVATVEVTAGPVSLNRVDGERIATVSAIPESQDLGGLSGRLTSQIDELDLPAGVTVAVGGATAEMNDAFRDLGLALAVAVMIVFIIMVGTFGSLIQPFILLISIPFAATGALLTLVVTGTPLGVPAFIGLLLLVGIVVANAIVLIDLINQYRRAGRPLDEAITEGARKRLRPILMTAAATVFALIPMALGLTGGGGSFISRPLALVVIGGLITSTLLTLIVVPVLYRFEAQAHDKRQAKSEARLEQRRQARIEAREALVSAARSGQPATD
ncbi:MAG: efflux RND transporter permease subunit [Bifidobacteriaceae bacterium]|jgi:HAE1 family hydrophobic/amphiphilic exporter-1|nr:efflux RND transporter permease subunit [Bifidobacteriaceae bacterium]